MNQKKSKLVITFHSTTEAIAMEMACAANGFPGRLIPVPRQISAGCGLAFCTTDEVRERLLRFMDENGLNYRSADECLL